MALQINTGLTTTDGGSVDSGSYIIFSTKFPYRGLSYSVEMIHYRSLGALDSGLTPIKVLEIPSYYYSHQFSQEEFLELTPMIVNEEAKAFLEQYVGVGNVQIIL